MAKIIDLSHSIESGMPVYPGDPQADVKPCCLVEESGYMVSEIRLGSHCGTHIDFPAHVIAGGKGAGEYGPDRFVADAIVCRVIDGFDAGSFVHDVFEPSGCDALVFASGASKLWGTEGYFEFDPRGFLNSAFLDAVSDFKSRGGGIKFVGMDCASPDPHDSSDLPAHHRLLSHGILIVENLCNLDLVIGKSEEMIRAPGFEACRVRIAALPLKCEAKDAAPVRAVAFL